MNSKITKRPSADFWIKKLGLTRHIEGGYFKEIYRSEIIIHREELPSGLKGKRNLSTAIYFLLEHGKFSAFHRIASDEQWHFYLGDALIVYELTETGTCFEHLLGSDPGNGENFQCVIKAGSWFAARLAPAGEYCLVGCTVAPGFDYEDFELAERDQLTARFPDQAALIDGLT